MAFDAKAVVKAANTRPDEDSYEHGNVHKLGSRVTSRQATVVHDTLTASQRNKLLAEYDGTNGIDLLRAYADTGERSYITAEQNEVLDALVKACREKMPNPSQARRVWPRKVAAAIVAEIDPPEVIEEPESSDDDASGEQGDEGSQPE